MYLLDADVLIFAHNNYYPVDRIPQFWDWLLLRAKENLIKLPLEINYEIVVSNDLLSQWVKTESKTILLDEEVDRSLFNEVLTIGYGLNLTDTDLKKISNDVFLITYAYKHKDDRIVVTREVSKPKKQKGNRKIPDVCKELGIQVINDIQLYHDLDFRIQ